MYDQEYDTDLDDEWLSVDERLICFRKTREKILWRVKVSESPYVQGTQYSEEDLFVREMFTSRTERLSVIEAVTDGNHAPVVQANNYSSSANIQ